MKIRLLLHTIVHLRARQIVWQVLDRVWRPRFRELEAPSTGREEGAMRTQMAEFIRKPVCCDGTQMTFLNITDNFTSWNDTRHGMLWAYNLNYMDWLNQERMAERDACQWIDRFVSGLSSNKIGLDPYPIALRSINWVKFFCRYPTAATKERRDTLYSQVLLLKKKLEYRLLGNHLLEDAYALYISSLYFRDENLLKKAEKLLKGQLNSQILPDGAHYEQSPMYHCILLERLLDCIKFSLEEQMVTKDHPFIEYLKDVAGKMLGHLESVVWQDGNIPLLNDSANGIAPTPSLLLAYAGRLNLQWNPIPMKECGYRKLVNDRMEAIVDVGNITASYQPGHTHADTFNFELHVDGLPFIIDTGISTYEKNHRRQYERGTSAHNTVTIDGRDSSEVWGGFRVGRRARVQLSADDSQHISATCTTAWGYTHQRTFALVSDAFIITDKVLGSGISRLHLSPDVSVCSLQSDGHQWHVVTTRGSILINGASHVEQIPCMVSSEYYRQQPTICIEIHFAQELEQKLLFI